MSTMMIQHATRSSARAVTAVTRSNAWLHRRLPPAAALPSTSYPATFDTASSSSLQQPHARYSFSSIRLQQTLTTSTSSQQQQTFDVNTHRSLQALTAAAAAGTPNPALRYSDPSPSAPSPQPPIPYAPLPTSPPTISPADFRRAFRSASSSVWLVTSSASEASDPVGFTAISIASVSVSPPMLSFNIGKTSSSLSTLSASRRFAVHLLDSSDASIALAMRFAAKPSSARFEDRSSWSWDERGLPNVHGALTRISGSIAQLVEAGDSWLAVGLVERIEHSNGTPLVHFSGAYRALPSDTAATHPTPTSPAPKPTITAPSPPATSVSTAPPPTANGASGVSVPTTAGAKGVTGSDGSLSTSFPPASRSKRRMYLNAFDMCCVGHQSPGVWSHPSDQSHRYKDLSYWTQLAQLLDTGGFDTLFIADVLGTYDVFRGNRHAAVKHGAQVPVNEPTLAIPAMAAVTKRLGFAATVSLTYEQPYSFARRMSTLDHLTEGRVAWNIVTSYLQSAAVNLGLNTQIPHDERYNLAEEYMQVCYKLWEQSWEEDAVIRDKQQRVFAQPHKVHDIGHQGKYYTVPGVHLCEPSPQRTPVLFQAGASSKGQLFAARHAEGVFVISVNTRHLRSQSASIRQMAASQGRDPASVKIFALLTPIVDTTDEKAQAKLAEYRRYASDEGAMALYGGWTGVDLSSAAPDAPLEYVENDSLRSVGEMFKRSDPSKTWTTRQVAEFLGIGGIGPVVVGSPTTVADELERWMAEGDIDGFNLAYAITPGTFTDFVQLVVPELRRRGLIDAEEGDGAGAGAGRKLTLRERLQGRARLADDHPGAQYRRLMEERRKAREEGGGEAAVTETKTEGEQAVL